MSAWQRVVITAKPPAGQTKKRNLCVAHKKYCACPAVLHSYCAVSNQPLNSTRRRLQLIYSGRVQGVGFRYTAKTVATGFEITGTIRNLTDGRVELIAEGNRTELEAYRMELHAAGLAGFIQDEQVIWAEAKNEFRGFEIIR